MTVINQIGQSFTLNDCFTILQGPVRPKANFTADHRSGNAPFTVNFTDLSTGNPTYWNWNFGDGGTSNEQNPTYTYNPNTG
jgi:PKD repeat protein